LDCLSSLLQQRRKELGLTLAQVAEKMGVTEATVQRWESGNIKSVRYERLERLAEVLHVSPSALMGWDQPDSGLVASPAVFGGLGVDTTTDILEIGHRIAMRRSQLGLTLDDIANDIGVARSTIQRYEKGRIHNVKLPVLEAIARSLKVNLSWLCGKSSHMEELPPPSPAPQEADGLLSEFLPLFEQLTQREQLLLIAQVEGILSSKAPPPDPPAS